jgi:hypothetical protein
MSDALVELEALLEELPAAVERRSLGEALTGASAKLRTAEHQVERIKALLSLADLVGFGSAPGQDDLVEDLRSEAADVGEALEAADKPDELERAVWRYEKDLAGEIGALDRALRQHWTQLSGRLFQPLVAVGELLRRISGESELGDQLVACGREAQSIPTGTPAPALLEAVRRLLTTRDQLQEQRRTALGEGEVADFINALAENRATLAMVTAEVRAWLDEHGASARLQIRPPAT